MKKSIIIIGSLAGAIIFFSLLNVFGWCIFSPCDTEIIITSHQIDSFPQYDQPIKSNFVIENTGSEIANNCVVEWMVASNQHEKMLSEKFSLKQDEEIKVKLEILLDSDVDRCLGNNNRVLSKATVFCENSSSPPSESEFQIPCP